MNIRRLSAIVVVLLIALSSGCRHRPKLASDYEPRDISIWDKLFGRGGSGGAGTGSGATIPAPKGDPGIITTELPNDGLFDKSAIGGPLSGGGGGFDGPGKRWDGIVYFAYNKSIIGESEREKLEGLADYLKRNAAEKVVIEGHADERGSEEYNRALGDRRAAAVRSYLENLGITEDRMQTISYGEEKLADNGTDESAHTKNRRGEFVIISPKP